LNLVVDTEEIAAPVPQRKQGGKVMDSGVVKKWNAAKSSDTVAKPAEKPVDFPKDTAHITAQSKSDSAK